MKTIVATAIACLLTTSSFAADDYVIIIDGESHDIGLGSEKSIALPDGRKLSIELKLKDKLQYEQPFFSFSHSSKFKPSVSDLGNGVHQTALITPEGVFILVQEHKKPIPSDMTDLLLAKLTREDIACGHQYKESAVTKKIGRLKAVGKRGVTTNEGDNWIQEVYTVGDKDGGLVIITGIDTESNAKEQYVIDDFWKTVKIRLP